MFVLKILVYLIFTTLSGRCYYIYTSEEAEPHGRQTIARISLDETTVELYIWVIAALNANCLEGNGDFNM